MGPFTKPGTLLRSRIPIRDLGAAGDATPGFVAIDPAGHEGGNAFGEHAHAWTAADIALDWTDNRAVRNKVRKWGDRRAQRHHNINASPALGN